MKLYSKTHTYKGHTITMTNTWAHHGKKMTATGQSLTGLDATRRRVNWFCVQTGDYLSTTITPRP